MTDSFVRLENGGGVSLPSIAAIVPQGDAFVAILKGVHMSGGPMTTTARISLTLEDGRKITDLLCK